MNETSLTLAESKQLTQAISVVWSGTAWIRAQGLATLANAAVAEVEGWLRSGVLFALELDGQRFLPQYAFRQAFSAAAVHRDGYKLLGPHHSSMSLALWFESTSSFLGGARQREMLSADPHRVIAAAQDRIQCQQNL